MKKVLVFFADGFEEIEGLTVIDLLRRAGIPVDMVSITDSRSVKGSHGIEILADITLSEADFQQAGMLVLPGGLPGTDNLEACTPLMEAFDSFYRSVKSGEDKYLAAICAAPTIFAHRGYLKGITACSYPSRSKEIEEGGATYCSDPCHYQDRILTGRGMGAAMDFGLKIVELFCGPERAEELRKAVVFNA